MTCYVDYSNTLKLPYHPRDEVPQVEQTVVLEHPRSPELHVTINGPEQALADQQSHVNLVLNLKLKIDWESIMYDLSLTEQEGKRALK